ncbi:MAG: hypothetical protein V1834_04505 [Candidatus Micrarchaeota archaeon]
MNAFASSRIFLLIALVLLVGCIQPTPPADSFSSPFPSPAASHASSVAPVASPESSLDASPLPSVGVQASPAPSFGVQASRVASTAVPEQAGLKLEDYDGGVFTIRKPVGWSIAVGGSCETFSFVIKDGTVPQRQIFYFGEIGPVYLDESQKTLDRQYMDMGGYPIFWYEMPVVKPLTPENFLQAVPVLSETSLLKQFMTALPELRDAEIISSKTVESPVAGNTKLMRALFKAGSGASEGLGEGQFFLTVSEVLPLTGFASGGIGYGFTFVGVSAGKKEFAGLEKTLLESINSFSFSGDYVADCLRQQQKTTEAILKAGETLSETSDIIMSEWEQRSRSDDILSEKRSDVILGRDRVYDPDTGVVYDVENGFYDDYNINREKFDMNRLQQLPADDWGLWTAATENADKIH